MVLGEPPPVAIEEQEVMLTENVIGCIGIVNAGDNSMIARANWLAQSVNPYPLLLLDLYYKVPLEPKDVAGLPSEVPFLQISSENDAFAKQALCMLAEQFLQDSRKRITDKLGC